MRVIVGIPRGGLPALSVLARVACMCVLGEGASRLEVPFRREVGAAALLLAAFGSDL